MGDAEEEAEVEEDPADEGWGGAAHLFGLVVGGRGCMGMHDCMVSARGGDDWNPFIAWAQEAR